MNTWQFIGLVIVSVLSSQVVGAVVNGSFGRRLASGQASVAEADSEKTEQETRTLVLQDARDQLAQSKRACEECNRRLSRYDGAIYELLDALALEVAPGLTDAERERRRAALRGVQEAMYDRPVQST